MKILFPDLRKQIYNLNKKIILKNLRFANDLRYYDCRYVSTN